MPYAKAVAVVSFINLRTLRPAMAAESKMALRSESTKYDGTEKKKKILIYFGLII